MRPAEIHAKASEVVSPIYLVGGSVRDALMGRESEDYDFATPLDPDAVEASVRAAGRRPYLVGKRYGTVGFTIEGHHVEVTTFRSESYENGSRRPRVTFLDSLADDLARRDFTINAMAMHGDELVDPVGGAADIEARLVRAVGDPHERFTEDPLRMLRAARFAAQLGFTVDAATAAAIVELAPRILGVARERWVAELDRLLVGVDPAAGLRLLAETGLLAYVLPELAVQFWWPQPDETAADGGLFGHTIEIVERVEADVELRWAALLHDVAVPLSVGAHAAELASALVDRLAIYLKWGTKRRVRVRELVARQDESGGPIATAHAGTSPEAGA